MSQSPVQATSSSVVKSLFHVVTTVIIALILSTLLGTKMNRDDVDINVIAERNSTKYMQGNFFKRINLEQMKTIYGN
jgi:hypothetical protein